MNISDAKKMFDPPNREEMVFEILSDGKVHCLAELAMKTGYPESSVSCNIRTLRKQECGGFRVVKELLMSDAHSCVYGYRLDA